jgi:succinoglycan biosynthesis protein ExoA
LLSTSTTLLKRPDLERAAEGSLATTSIAAAERQQTELVTVVIPARNEEHSIGRCLESVLNQQWPALQVIVVDGASTDRTAEVVATFSERDPRVELLHNSRRIIPVALNLALAAAQGAWLVRIDAHATVPPDYVRIAVQHLHGGHWGGVGGRKNGRGVTPAGMAIAAAMASRFGVGNSTYHYGERQQLVEHVPFGCYPVWLLRAMGGWDESLPVNQDFELDYRLRRAGYELLFDPALVIDWECRQTIGHLYRQYKRYGAGKVAVARKHPRSMRGRHLMAPALVASWALAAAVAWRRPRLAVAALSPYPVALAAATAMTAPRVVDESRGRRWVAPAFLAMHAGWGVGFWSALLRPRRR